MSPQLCASLIFIFSFVIVACSYIGKTRLPASRQRSSFFLLKRKDGVRIYQRQNKKGSGETGHINLRDILGDSGMRAASISSAA